MAEEWRPIPSAPGYEASSEGRVRNARTGRVLVASGRGGVTGQEYLALHLGRHRRMYVHVAVCEAFHGPRPLWGRSTVDHKDEDHMNNRPGNLQWATNLQNNQWRGARYRARQRACSTADIVGSERQAGDVF